MTPLNDNDTTAHKKVTHIIPEQVETTSGFRSAESSMFRSVSMSTSAPQPRLFLEGSPKTIQKSHSSPFPPSSDCHSSASVSWVWKINQLHPVPRYHPLERSAVTIEDLTVDTVTARISGFMKNESITCSYHSDVGRVDCLTDGLLKFVVQLWQGSSSADDDDRNKPVKIVMEVQRRQGCSMQLQVLRKKLVRAITNKKPSCCLELDHTRTTCEFLESFVLDDTNTGATTISPLLPPLEKDYLSATLELCRRMLESGRLDENRLGLESLCILTDPSKVLAKNADQASRVILSDSSYQTLLAKYFVHTELNHNHEPNTMMHTEGGVDDDDIAMDYEQGQFFGCLHFLALQVLSHALESVARFLEKSSSRHRTSSSLSIDFSALFWQRVMQALYYNLKVASRRPLEASLSIRCLRLLQTVEPSTTLESVAPANQRHLYECLLSARQYGRRHSRSLEQETEELMGRLGFVH